MDGPSSKLASRFRRALETEEVRRVREAEEARLAREDARRAREELLGQIAETGREIGLRVERSDAGVTLRHGPRHVHFGRDGDADRVRVAHDGADDGVVFRQPELGNRWVLARKTPREIRVPFFDQGLEDVLVRILGLPRPPAE